MIYEKNVQKEEWYRSLAVLIKDLEKRKEMARLRYSIEEQKKFLKKREELLKKLKEIPELLELQRIRFDDLKETLKDRIDIIFEEVELTKSDLSEKESKYKKISDEVETIESNYFLNRDMFENVKIKKGQVNAKEFESLMYFMWLTGLAPNVLFEDVFHIYPGISCKLKETYRTGNFYQANFEEVFDIWL